MRIFQRLNLLSTLAFLHDVSAAAVAWLLAYWLRLNLDVPAELRPGLWRALLVCVPIQAYLYIAFGLYRGLWRFASLPDLRRILIAVGIGAVVGPFALLMLGQSIGVPRSVFLLEPILLLLIMGGNRLAYRSWKEHRLFGATVKQGAPVLVIGTGDAAITLVRDLARSPDWRVVGLIDDNPKLAGRVLQNVHIVGGVPVLAEAARRHAASHAIIALPEATHQERRRIVNACQQAGLTVLTIPSFDDLMSGKVQISAIRQVELLDLLGRDPVVLDSDGLKTLLSGTTVMITGAGGSIGSELVRQITRFSPVRMILVENGEFALYNIEQELRRIAPLQTFSCVIGDVRNADRMREVLNAHKPSVVFHAAAYKHVPLMETENAWEALCNNALGTATLGVECIAAGVAKFVLISTDKAVNPANVMGASKRLAELVCQSLGTPVSQAYDGAPDLPPKTRFVMVRFGNVLGSTGSVIPKFKEQIAAGGPVTVTHPDIVRYFMSIPEAAQLVLQAGLMGQGGEIFVLDMGEPVKIADLARDMIRLSGFSEDDIRIEYSGLRPGEKLYEELLADSETTLPTPHPKLRIAKPGETPDTAWRADLLNWLAGPAPGTAAIKAELRRRLPEYAPGDNT